MCVCIFVFENGGQFVFKITSAVLTVIQAIRLYVVFNRYKERLYEICNFWENEMLL